MDHNKFGRQPIWPRLLMGATWIRWNAGNRGNPSVGLRQTKPHPTETARERWLRYFIALPAAAGARLHGDEWQASRLALFHLPTYT